eukprot:s39_g2.t1
MSCPFSAGELADLVSKLGRLQEWQAQLESGAVSQPSSSGYTRGDPKARAQSAGIRTPSLSFPGIPQIAKLWKLVKEEGPAVFGCTTVRAEVGPGPVPLLVEDQASFVCWDQKEALQRIHLAFAAGFWARVALETFTDQVLPREDLEEATHFIVLRACGLGGFVRFASRDHFDRFRDQVFAGGFLCHSFITETELEVFCQGAKLAVDIYAVVLELRQGGMLLAVPPEIMSPQVIADGQSGSEEHLFGPNSVFEAELIEETEDLLSTVALGIQAQVLVVDSNDDILAFCREYDPVTDSHASILGFSTEHPNSLPDTAQLMPLVREWLLQRSDDRSGFYTAQEDQVSPTPKAEANGAVPPSAPGKRTAQPKRVSNAMIADQLSALSAQMQLLAQRQDQLEKSSGLSAGHVPDRYVGPTSKLPSVSAGLANPSGLSQTAAAKALHLLGPPPKVKVATAAEVVTGVGNEEPYDVLQPTLEDPSIAAALAQQSTAITALVAHLAAQGGDAMGDLTSLATSSSSTKGVQRREKMQNDLASGASSYFLQMMQQLHRRLHPSKPVPQTEEGLTGVSVLQYLERQGGYRSQRELGLVAWVLGHAIDSAASGNFKHTKEILALLLVAVEQAVVDRGDWTLAYMLTLMEEPPLQVFQDRTLSVAQHAKPFGPLVPPQWTAVCLSYLKDLEVLSTKKTETAKKAAKAVAPSTAAASPVAEPDQETSPRRKPRFPRKPKAKASPEA